MTSLKLNYLLKGPSPNIITLGVRASTYELGEDTIQSITLGNNAAVHIQCPGQLATGSTVVTARPGGWYPHWPGCVTWFGT